MKTYTPPPKLAMAFTPKAKATKAKKDPNRPKKGRTPYIIFSREEAKKVRAENPDLKTSEVMRLVGLRWAACANKQFYEDQVT